MAKTRTISAIALLACTLCGCTPPRPRNPDAAQKRYLLAADFFNRGMIPAANEELRQAFALDDRNVEAIYLSGLIQLREAAGLEEDARRARCLSGSDMQLVREDMTKHMKGAEQAFRKALTLQADFSDAWNALSSVALHFKRWDEAQAAAEKALSNPGYQTPWFALANQGTAYFEKRDYLRASKVLRQALAQNKRFCVARWRLAQVYESQKEYEASLQELQTLAEGKNCPIQEAYLLLGRVALRLQDRARAEEAFQECLRLAPQSCTAKECRIED